MSRYGREGEAIRTHLPPTALPGQGEREGALVSLRAVRLNQVTVAVSDLERSLDFYRRLGLIQIVAAEHYARFACPDGDSTFSLQRADTVTPAATVVYFECDDLDGTVSALARGGVEIEQPPRDEPWLWREARLRDPDGNPICLFHAGENRLDPPWRLRS